MSKGIIYVLTNPAMPDLIKIGKTTNLDQRLSSLYSTGVPLPFECIYAKEVEDMDFVETKLHAAFDSKRLNNRREFFKILEEELIHFFDLIPGNDVTPQEENFETDEDRVAFENETRIRERFNFNMINIQPGTTLKFTRDENITCEVTSKTRVNFRGQNHSLSSAALILMNEQGYNWGKIQGPRFWTYNGKTLSELRREVEEN